MIRLAIICGGISKERGISLNSARSFLDHVYPLGLDLTVLYLDTKQTYYKITHNQLYSNTPSDFDFKLEQIAKRLSENELIVLLKGVDLVFPLIHGVYGEDGQLQSFLEKHGIRFVGSSSEVCHHVFNKYRLRQQLLLHGFSFLPSLLIGSAGDVIENFWRERKVEKGILKPTNSGSSIGVKFVSSLENAKKTITELREKGFHELLLEPYCEDSEFTVCVLQNLYGEPVSLIPLEIDIGNDPEGILDYRRKYLPNEQTRYFCPPRYSDADIAQIRKEAERLFKVLKLRDFARIDGWIAKDGSLRFSDINPISGMEQNSFIFQQSSRVGVSHPELIRYILQSALQRCHNHEKLDIAAKKQENAQRIFVLMGGNTAERQVSLMSGTNVWLKLLHSEQYKPLPFLMENDEKVWQLPYAFALHHTVEEILEHCKKANQISDRLLSLTQEIRAKLLLPNLNSLEMPQSISMGDFIKQAKQENAFVFIALHGGIGENGTLQRLFEAHNVHFNGSKSHSSELCMDKHLTAMCVASLNDPDILAMPQFAFHAGSFFNSDDEIVLQLWQQAVIQLKTSDLIVKPQCDGCSSGVVRLSSSKEFLKYIDHLRKKTRYLDPNTFQNQNSIVEMPAHPEGFFLIEPYIHTDKIKIEGNDLIYNKNTGWIEMTIGVIEKSGDYTALHPSITVAESHVLSVEEKFQGGTGINITPPPEHILSAPSREKVQRSICTVAKALGIRNYARLDMFVECKTGKIQIIEANSLPALTPSTVIYHQALSAPLYMTPRQFLINVIQSSSESNVNAKGH